MIKKNKWTAGIPTQNGVYWFKTGIEFPNERQHILILRKYTDWASVVGHGGSGPLDMFYSSKVDEKIKARGGKGAQYMMVEAPNPDIWEWSMRFNKDHSYAWVKDKDGYIGFGLINGGWHEPSVSILYLNHPTQGESYGVSAGEDDGYTFQKVILPEKE